MEITYTLVGDYYRPNLVAPESPKVGRWGMLRFWAWVLTHVLTHNRIARSGFEVSLR